MLRTLTTGLAALTLGVLGATVTIAAADDPTPATLTTQTDDPTTAPTDEPDADDDGNGDGDATDCGPGGWLRGPDGDLRPWAQDFLDDVPAQLRRDLEAAFAIDDPQQRRDALLDIRERALAGDYGKQVKEQAESLRDLGRGLRHHLGDWDGDGRGWPLGPR